MNLPIHQISIEQLIVLGSSVEDTVLNKIKYLLFMELMYCCRETTAIKYTSE